MANKKINKLMPVENLGIHISNLLAIFLMGMYVTACAESNIPWRLDSLYSEYLTINASNYRAMTGNDIADTTDAMRIYKTSGTGRKMFSLSHVLNEDPIYESKDKQLIKGFISAAQETIMSVPNCFEHRDRDTFHILVFDNTFMRAGYFLVIKCTADNERFGIISPLQKGGGGSIYYSRSVITILEKLNILDR